MEVIIRKCSFSPWPYLQKYCASSYVGCANAKKRIKFISYYYEKKATTANEIDTCVPYAVNSL